MDDDLKPLLRLIETSDAVVLGSPVYYGNLSGQMRSFTDRLLFQYLDYGGKAAGPKPKSFKTALVPTMNVDYETYVKRGFRDTLVSFAQTMSRTLGSCELLPLTNTVMLEDYSKYVYEMPDLEEKSKRIDKISAQDLQKAFELGARLAQP